jgi:hypothetical protein
VLPHAKPCLNLYLPLQPTATVLKIPFPAVPSATYLLQRPCADIQQSPTLCQVLCVSMDCPI